MMWASHKQTKRLLTFSPVTEKNATKGNTKVEKDVKDKFEGYESPTPSYTKSQMIGLFLGPLLFLLTLFVFPLSGLSEPGRAVMAITLWIATWWITEAIPIPLTSLMPIVLLPLMGTISGDLAAKSFGDPLIFLFLGGFAIAIAMEKWNLHERIALTIIAIVGTSTAGIVFGFMIATAFISMWVSNTATVMMMLPIGTAIAAKVVDLMKQEGVYSEEDDTKITKSLIFAIGFGGTIGGASTLIGTPPNLILAGMVQELFGIEISFASWFFFAFPMTTVLLVFAGFYLTKIAYPMKVKKLNSGRAFVVKSRNELGRMSYEEKVVLAVFSLTAFMWLSRTFLWQGIIPGISDTMIAVTGALLLYLFPASKGRGRILDQHSIKQMPWGVLLLVGGGLSLATGFRETDLANWIGSQLLYMEHVPFVVALLVTTLLALALTEITPNTATTTILVPVVASLALAIDVHPFPLMFATALGAGFAFMLPIGTPSNAIIFATGKLTIMDMVKKGFWMNIIAIISIVAAVYILLPIVFGIDLFHYPESLK